MIARLLLLALAVLAFDSTRADACCVGCPCTKYQPREETVQQPVYGYTHSLKGGLPAWSVARIAAFLVRGTWTPILKPPPGGPAFAPLKPATIDGVPITYNVVPAAALRFFMADKADTIPKDIKQRPVLIRRIEKVGKAILVEVDNEVWKLAACPRKPGFVCLGWTNGEKLTPIEPPAAQ